MTKNPKIKKWDRIYIEVEDRFGKKFKTVVHVKKRKPVRKRGKGLQLKLICPHQSSNLLTRKIFKPNKRESGYNSINDALNVTNTNKFSKDPEIVIKNPFVPATKFGNNLDQATFNNYIFESIKLGKAIEQTLEKESQPIEQGGSLGYNYARFQSLYDHATGLDIDKVGIQIFEQGFKNNGGQFTNVPTVTLEKKATDAIPNGYMGTDGNQDSERGTNIIVIANKEGGSQPRNFMIYQGEKDAFRLAREWILGIKYKVGARTKFEGNFYSAISEHTSSNTNDPGDTPSSTWSTAETFSPSVDYSPMTKLKAQYWINSMAGAKYAATAGKETAVIDHNVIIKDKLHPRTYVDMFATDEILVILNTDLMLNGLPYDSFRVLVNGTGTGTFSGTDINGVSFSNNVIEFRNPSGVLGQGNWVVFKVVSQDQEIFNWDETESWTYKPCEGGTSFVDGAGICQLGSRNSGWVKGSYRITNIAGIGSFGRFQTDAQFECIHPVNRDGSNVIEVGNDKISDDDIAGNSAVFAKFKTNQATFGRDFFAGLNFHSLFPHTRNGIPFGVVNIGEQIALEVFDFFNMHRNKDGGRITYGDKLEELYPIQAIGFWTKIQDQLTGGVFAIGGNYSLGIWLADRKDNKVRIDVVIGHNSTNEEKLARIGSHKTQRSIPGIVAFLAPPEVEALDIFDWRSFKVGGIETLDSFDPEGRFNGLGSRFLNGTSTIKFFIDAFRYVKPIVGTNIDPSSLPDRNIEPEIIQAQEIISYRQAKNLAISLEPVFQFEREHFAVKTQLRADVDFGDPVYYKDPEIIDVTTDGKTNTVKAVAESIIYSISKTAAGEGGFIRIVNLVTRLWF